MSTKSFLSQQGLSKLTINKTSSAWENSVGGCVTPVAGNWATQFGMVYHKFPTIEPQAELPYRADKLMSRWTTHWLIPTEHIARLATDDFWGSQGVARYGPAMLQPPKLIGVWRFSAYQEHVLYSPKDSSGAGPTQGGGLDGLLDRPIRRPQYKRIRDASDIVTTAAGQWHKLSFGDM